MAEFDPATGTYIKDKPKRLSNRFTWVKWLFYVVGLGNLLMLVGSVMLLGFDYSVYNAEVDISSADWFLMLGGVIYTLSFIGSVIAFSMFSHRAMKNLHAWESRSADMSPGWTVGWYFIPFANLWKPFEAMTQIWDGTTEVTSPKVSIYPKIGLWWMFWILTNISANVSFRTSMNGDFTESSIKFVAIADIVSSVTGLIAIFVIIPILGKITEMQDGKLQGEVFE